MSSLGKQVHLGRIFSHPSGRILAIAIDHLINYPLNMPEGLRRLGSTIAQIAEGKPSSITLNKGAAMRFMPAYAGKVPFIVQQIAIPLGDDFLADHASVEEVAAMGADAIAVSLFVKGPTQGHMLRHLGHVVTEAERYGLPVIAHLYPLGPDTEQPEVHNNPEDILYAVRVGLEMGVDVIKVPYTGDVASFRDIVAETPVPVVTAGGPKCETREEAAAMVRDVVRTGAAGSTIGRNVWGFPDIPRAMSLLREAMFGAEGCCTKETTSCASAS